MFDGNSHFHHFLSKLEYFLDFVKSSKTLKVIDQFGLKRCQKKRKVIIWVRIGGLEFKQKCLILVVYMVNYTDKSWPWIELRPKKRLAVVYKHLKQLKIYRFDHFDGIWWLLVTFGTISILAYTLVSRISVQARISVQGGRLTKNK